MTQTPKVEKKTTVLSFKLALSQLVGNKVFSGIFPDANIHDIEVVNAEYVSALETALKAARELISDSSTEINEPYLYDRYWDALAKVDLK